MKQTVALLAGLALFAGLYVSRNADEQDPRVLVFSKTEGYRHASIEAGKAALLAMGQEHGFAVDTTEDATVFNEQTLKAYHAVVFLNTTGDILDEAQQLHFRRYIQAGGGYAGIHSATDTEYDWPWYGKLAGAYFNGHPSDPNVRNGVLDVVEHAHPSTEMLPDPWARTDEWYDFRSLNPDVHVLLTIDESTYKETVEHEDHPMAWYHDYDGGRAFYTASGHTSESFSEPLFLEHLLGGLHYVMGDGSGPDYGSATVVPEENRFTKVVLDYNLYEPMELDLLPDGRILFVERRGAVKVHDPRAGRTETIATIDVFSEFEEGLLGVALDPGYATNHWVYFTYSAPDEPEIRVARFVLDGTALDTASEKVLLKIPVQRDECCHVAGALEFGPDGTLFISIGDNTNPFASDGYAPIDEQPGRSPWDAQKSSANTDDLRGKILRIKPEPDGTYSIPDGNLFAKDGSEGRPEIYVMGNRNPFRISIDTHTGYLYWGEVGPDAGEDGPMRGPKGHDEVNQARGPGNFGWPHFVGDNKSYYDYDFAGRSSDDPFDPVAPLNDSPNNTGARILPPAQPAFIWYPYDASAEFPVVGEGGRNAMAGPVYYFDDYDVSDHAFPKYYDGTLFIYDWMRGWIMAVTMDEEGDLVHLERFMPNTVFNNPVDMLFGPDGTMYLLEYGTGWYTQNMDARLVRIEYAADNRAPVARIEADRTVGAAPLTVAFSGQASSDPDADALRYAWTFDDASAEQSTEAEQVFTFEQPGLHKARLTVTDPDGETARTDLDILVGNDPPEVFIAVNGNQTFYWDEESFGYDVFVTDTEDGSLEDGGIAPEQVAVTVEYLPQGADLTLVAQGHKAVMETARAGVGRTLIDQSDCQACHKQDDVSIGPSYVAIADRYEDDDGAAPRLAEKVIRGGSGVWGEQAMAAHPQLSREEAEEMVSYILSLADEVETAAATMPLSGTYTTTAHIGAGEEGRYLLTASYADRGGDGVGALTGRVMVVLRHPRVQAETFNAATDDVQIFPVPEDTPGIEEPTDLVIGPNNAYIVFQGIDLTGVGAISAQAGLFPGATIGGVIGVHLDRPDGELVGVIDVKQGPTTVGIHTYTTQIMPIGGVHDLVVVFRNEDQLDATDAICSVNWFHFHREDGAQP